MSWKVLAVVASMSLVAAACGGGGSKKAVTGQTGTTAAPGEGTPKAGGNLIIGVTSEVSGMDPSKRYLKMDLVLREVDRCVANGGRIL